MKTLFYAAMLAALVPFIGAAQKAASGYAHMQQTAYMLADPAVQRDYSKFAACAAAVQREGADLAGAQTGHEIDADPAQCHASAATRWVAVR